MNFLWITSLLVCIGHAIDPICNVTSNSKQWTYQIIGDENPPCTTYQWTNETNFVLANNKNASVRDIVVPGWNATHLTLSVCMENIKRNRICPKEDREHSVQCQVDCTESSKPLLYLGIILPIGVLIAVLFAAGLALTVPMPICCRGTRKGAERERERDEKRRKETL